MQISVVRPRDLAPSEIALWHSMQRQMEHLRNPFLCPEFAIAVDKFRSRARVAVLTDGPQIVGFMPFERRQLGVGVPIGAGLNDCQGLVHAPGVTWDSQELLRSCNLLVWQFNNLVEGQRAFECYAAGVAPSPVIDLSDGFALYEQNLKMKSPQFFKDMARKERKLERNAGKVHFVMDSRDITALRALIEWKSDQYRRNKWLNIFDRHWVVDLVEYLFSTRSDIFSGLLSVLYAEETPIAAHFGLNAGHMLAHWFPSYDINFSKHSPGLIQHLRMIEQADAIDINIIDMGVGGERYKQTLKNRDLFVYHGMVGRSPLITYACRMGSGLASQARQQMRQHPALFGTSDQLMRYYGRIH